jgi:oxygen-dependent protoporphyrinogen oxidase
MSNGASAERRRVAVIGGGISGLAAAHRLVELQRDGAGPFEIHLFEAADRLGGVIASETCDGFVIEGGPDSILSEKPAGLALCERLGLTEQLIRTREEMRRTYIAFGGKLHALPDGFLLLAPTRFLPLALSPLFTPLGKLRMALDLVLPRGAPQRDESLASFVRRRLGNEALERVAQPLVGGIYTADPETLSLAATMPRFLEMERRQRSVIRAMWQQQRRQGRAAPGATSGARWSLFVSFAGGLQTLVDGVAAALGHTEIHLRHPVKALRPDGGRWRVDDELPPFDAVIVATPAHVAAEQLGEIDDHLRRDLAAISYTSSATVTFAYRRDDVPHPLDGFGFVVPNIERRPLIACTFSSLKYDHRAPSGHLLLRSFVGGALRADAAELGDDQLCALVREQLAELLGIRRPPHLVRVHRHARAMPQYQVGHLDRVGRIEQHVALRRGLAVAGNAYRGVGIPDCIASAERAAEAIAAAFGGARGDLSSAA